MSAKPWEGRTVWVHDPKDKTATTGWIEVQEIGPETMRLIVRRAGLSAVDIPLSRDQAKTFAAHMMNLAGRAR